jgi:hypothetical protein
MKYLASHLVAGDGNEEEVSLIGILGAEARLANVLEEIAFACVLSRELPWCLVKGVGISVWVYIDLEIGLHFSVIQREKLGRMVNTRELVLVLVLIFVFRKRKVVSCGERGVE